MYMTDWNKRELFPKIRKAIRQNSSRASIFTIDGLFEEAKKRGAASPW